MADITKTFEKCNRILQINPLDILKISKAKGIEDEKIFEAIDKGEDKKGILRALNFAGLSITELGQLLGVTKQAIHLQIGLTGKRVEDDYTTKPDFEELKLKLWKEALINKSVWGTKGRLTKKHKMKILQNAGYTYKESERNYKKLDGDKITVLFVAKLGLTGIEEQKQWYYDQKVKGYNQPEILELLLKNTVIDCHIMTFNRYLRDKLNIVESVRGKYLL